MKETIQLPEDVIAGQEGSDITIEGDFGSVTKTFNHPSVYVTVQDDAIEVESDRDNRPQKAVVGTFRSHIQNMIEGVTDGYRYDLTAVYAHFPMTVSVEGDEVVVQNYIGEQAPRRVSIPDGVTVDIDEDDLTVYGADKEAVAQTAANIEQICEKGKRDPRQFQDGIYITEKGVYNG